MIASAVGINDLGDIVGRLRQSGAARNTSRGFVIDMLVTDANGDPVTDRTETRSHRNFTRFPMRSSNPRGLMEVGSMTTVTFWASISSMTARSCVHTYLTPALTVSRFFGQRISVTSTPISTSRLRGLRLTIQIPYGDDLQITGSLPSSSGGGVAFRYTLGGALEVFDPFVDSSGNTIMLTHVGGISQSGTVFGSADVVFPKKKRGQTSTRALFRYGTSAEMFEWEYNEGATGFNDVGDFVAGSERLYVEGVGLLLDIFDLIDTFGPRCRIVSCNKAVAQVDPTSPILQTQASR